MGIINPAELDLKEEVVVKINRTAKVTSRGKRFRFSALVVVGDGNGHVGVCLLYTSPSPRDRTRSRMPSSA